MPNDNTDTVKDAGSTNPEGPSIDSGNSTRPNEPSESAINSATKLDASASTSDVTDMFDAGNTTEETNKPEIKVETNTTKTASTSSTSTADSGDTATTVATSTNAANPKENVVELKPSLKDGSDPMQSINSSINEAQKAASSSEQTATSPSSTPPSTTEPVIKDNVSNPLPANTNNPSDSADKSHLVNPDTTQATPPATAPSPITETSVANPTSIMQSPETAVPNATQTIPTNSPPQTTNPLSNPLSQIPDAVVPPTNPVPTSTEVTQPKSSPAGLQTPPQTTNIAQSQMATGLTPPVTNPLGTKNLPSNASISQPQSNPIAQSMPLQTPQPINGFANNGAAPNAPLPNTTMPVTQAPNTSLSNASLSGNQLPNTMGTNQIGTGMGAKNSMAGLPTLGNGLQTPMQGMNNQNAQVKAATPKSNIDAPKTKSKKIVAWLVFIILAVAIIIATGYYVLFSSEPIFKPDIPGIINGFIGSDVLKDMSSMIEQEVPGGSDNDFDNSESDDLYKIREDAPSPGEDAPDSDLPGDGNMPPMIPPTTEPDALLPGTTTLEPGGDYVGFR